MKTFLVLQFSKCSFVYEGTKSTYFLMDKACYRMGTAVGVRMSCLWVPPARILPVLTGVVEFETFSQCKPQPMEGPGSSYLKLVSKSFSPGESRLVPKIVLLNYSQS